MSDTFPRYLGCLRFLLWVLPGSVCCSKGVSHFKPCFGTVHVPPTLPWHSTGPGPTACRAFIIEEVPTYSDGQNARAFAQYIPNHSLLVGSFHFFVGKIWEKISLSHNFTSKSSSWDIAIQLQKCVQSKNRNSISMLWNNISILIRCATIHAFEVSSSDFPGLQCDTRPHDATKKWTSYLSTFVL